jgi:hypothetical protein
MSRFNEPVYGIVKLELVPGVDGQLKSHEIGLLPQSISVIVIVGGDGFETKRFDAIKLFSYFYK